jgi:hypothetical protein
VSHWLDATRSISASESSGISHAAKVACVREWTGANSTDEAAAWTKDCSMSLRFCALTSGAGRHGGAA